MRSSRSEVRCRRDTLVGLVEEGITRVEALALRLGVSPSTIRRDLSALEASNRLSRTYGGAKETAHFTELKLRERMRKERGAKRAIGAVAASMISDGDSVFLDAGSTCAALVEHLPKDIELKVVTRGPELAILLADWPRVTTSLTGGVVAPVSHGLIGAGTVRSIQQYRFDLAFLGVDAVHPVDGIGEPTLEEVATKEVAAERARGAVVLADHTKLHPSSVPVWTAMDQWTLVTDSTVNSPDCAADPVAFRRRGVEVVIADSPGEAQSAADLA